MRSQVSKGGGCFQSLVLLVAPCISVVGFFRFIFILYVLVFCQCVCLDTTICMLDTHGGQKRVLDPLTLELLPTYGCWEPKQVLWRGTSALHPWAMFQCSWLCFKLQFLQASLHTSHCITNVGTSSVWHFHIHTNRRSLWEIKYSSDKTWGHPLLLLSLNLTLLPFRKCLSFHLTYKHPSRFTCFLRFSSRDPHLYLI